jgi:hypothetical protein
MIAAAATFNGLIPQPPRTCDPPISGHHSVSLGYQTPKRLAGAHGAHRRLDRGSVASARRMFSVVGIRAPFRTDSGHSARSSRLLERIVVAATTAALAVLSDYVALS